MNAILHNSEHLLALLNDILDITKIESGQLKVEHIRCNPWEIIDKVIAMMRGPAGAKQLSVSVENIGPIPETIVTDPLRFRQILTNLVGNAIKFTTAGSIRVTATLLRDNLSRPLLALEVVDTGIGLSEATIGKLFDRFSQADNSITRQFGGSGLGLAIAKRLAMLLGGDITVQSALGQGSRFRFTVQTGPLDGVPLLENPQAAPAATRSEKKRLPSASGERILLAEDSIDNQRIICLILSNAGFKVTVAENGQVACEKALAAVNEGRPYDLILMDMQMPIIGGHEATRLLRTAGYTRPIVALTANATVEDRQKCLDAGCDFYVSKPVNRAELLAVATDCVRQSAEEGIAPLPI